MRGFRLSLVVALALLAGACVRSQPRYAMTDGARGLSMSGAPVAAAPFAAQAAVPDAAASYAAPPAGRGLFAASGRRSSGTNWSASGSMAAGRSEGRGLLSAAPRSAPAVSVAPPTAALAEYPRSARVYAPSPAAYQPAYTLDAGDKLRIVVFGQDGISSSYLVDAGGNVTLPLIGNVPARGFTTTQLARSIAARLRQGYVRDPKVTVEVEVYRPFFILGEVTTPGQYPFSPNMTAEMAVAIAGGFGPRASKTGVKVTRNAPGQQFSGEVPLNFPLRPGDTVVVKERWF